MHPPLSPQDFYQQVHRLKNNEPYQQSINQGQQPQTFMISCCDSRVDPALLLGADLGRVFSLRVIANLIPPHNQSTDNSAVAAAILYAIEHLRIPQIIVLGHSACGGIQALCQHQANQNPSAIDSWLSGAADSLTHPLATFPEAIISPVDQQSLRTLASSYQHLHRYPIVQEALQAGTLSIEAWFYHMEKTALYSYDEDKETFMLAAD